MSSTSDTSDREIVITRVVNAPRELVFEAWSNPDHIAKWWGPNGFTTTTRSMDFRPGGVWEHVMHGPDGTDYPNYTVYDEIKRPERIVYTNSGGKDDASETKFQSTVTLEDLGGGQTRITMRGVFPSAEARDFAAREYGAVEGGEQTLARLAEHLKTM
jgi:uncharacterized protein YndB with AHSA1/START domain